MSSSLHDKPRKEVKVNARDKELTEDAIERYLRQQCMKLGAIVIKMKPFNGFPDRQVLWGDDGSDETFQPGVPVQCTDLVELKRPKGGRYEPLQERWRAKLKSMGYEVFVLRTKAQVDAYISSRKPFHRPGSPTTLSLTPVRRGPLRWRGQGGA